MTMHENELGFIRLVHSDKNAGFTITKQDNKFWAYIIMCVEDRIQRQESRPADQVTPDDVDHLEYLREIRKQVEYIRNSALKG